MAANLVRTYDADRAHQLLSLSFAQFQADRDVVRIERRLQRQRERYESLRADATSPYGDIDEYRAESQRGHAAVRDDPTSLAMMALRPGDVIHVSKGKHHGPVAVVATAHRKGGMKVTAITPSGHALGLAAEDFAAPPRAIGSVVLPGTYSPNRRDYRVEVGKRVRSAKLAARHRDDAGRPRPGTGMHPVEADPDLQARLRAAGQADRVAREIRELEHRVEHRNATLAREFDAVLDVLSERGYVDLEAWRLTVAGEMLARVFHESDLLVAEALRLGLLDGVDSPTLAGLVSTFVYEHRSPDEPPAPWFPSGEARARWESIEQLSRELEYTETQHGLAQHRPPEPTFFAVAYAWVAGEGFAELVADEDLTGGDFVRTIKQLIDVLGQIAQVAPDAQTRTAARRAAERAFRGVIADSSSVEAS
jgi:ATP-dependent RNA helicase HelY